jgi:hypothetical protein
MQLECRDGEAKKARECQSKAQKVALEIMKGQLQVHHHEGGGGKVPLEGKKVRRYKTKNAHHEFHKWHQ